MWPFGVVVAHHAGNLGLFQSKASFTGSTQPSCGSHHVCSVVMPTAARPVRCFSEAATSSSYLAFAASGEQRRTLDGRFDPSGYGDYGLEARFRGRQEQHVLAAHRNAPPADTVRVDFGLRSEEIQSGADNPDPRPARTLVSNATRERAQIRGAADLL